MIIKHLELEGVCPLDDRSLDFFPEGINVLLGPNESGKSTLAEAVIAIIFGINRDIQLQPMPGAEERFNGVLEIELGENEYRLEREFTSDHTKIIKRSGGEREILFEGDANPRGRTEEPELYREILANRLGLPSASTMKNSSFVGQMDISVDLGEELRKQISGAGQGDYKQAADSLRDQYYQLTREGLPEDRARRKDREIQKIEEEMKELKEELIQAKDKSRDVIQKQDEQAVIQEELFEVEAERDRAQKQYESLDEYHSLVEKQESVYQQKQIQEKSREQVSNLRNEIGSIQQDLEDEKFHVLRDLSPDERKQLKKYVQSDAEEAWEELQGLKEEKKKLLQELEDPRYEAFSAADEDTGDELKAFLKAKRELSGAKDQLENLEPEKKSAPARLAWLVPAVLTLLGFPFGYLLGRLILPGLELPIDPGTGSWIVGGGLAIIGLVIGLGIYMLIKLTSKSPERKQIELESKQKELEKEISQLQEALDGVYDPEKDEISLEVLIDRWDHWEERRQEVEALDNKLSTLREREIFSIRENDMLREIIDNTGSKVLEERITEYEALRSKLTNQQETLENLTGSEDINSEDIEKLDRRLQEVVPQIKAIEEDYPSFASLKDDEEKRLRRLEENKKAYQELEQEYQELQEKLIQSNQDLAVERAAEFRDPPLIKEEIEEKEEVLERLWKRKDALQIAYVMLGEAITEYEVDHLNRLSEQTSEMFQIFTDARYEGVDISGEQPIRVHPAEGQPFEADLLSVGAVDQLYLAMRIAVTDLLSSKVKLPFIFDDSFVNFDEQRLAAARDVLSEIAGNRQVILLSHDERYHDWGKQVISL